MAHLARDTTVLVTGATDGIGKATARLLVERGARVLVHGRTLKKAEQARAEVGAHAAVAADLSRLDEVRTLARAIDGLDVLINNAGVFCNERVLTEDGRELTMAVNHDAPFLLTHLLLPVLERSIDARVVNVSSIAHSRGRIDLEDLDLARSFDGYGAYAASKLANVLFTAELARRLERIGKRVKVNALHPGVVSTKLLRAGFSMRGPDSLEEGSATSVLLALDDVPTTGGYFVACRPAEPSRAARDAGLAERFYLASCRRVDVPPLS